MSKVVGTWAKDIANRNPEKQTELYSDGAVLFATYENNLLVGKSPIQGYFKEFLDKDDLTCTIITIHEQKSKTGVSIYSGLYAFDFTKDGNPQSVMARYTFVIYAGKIVNHHSSLTV